MDNRSGQSQTETDSPSAPNFNSSSASSSTHGLTYLNNFIMQDKVSFVLWITRMATIVFTLLFIFPFTAYDPNTLYQKTLMASAATSALKLHQRMANIPFAANREYFAKLMIEDSCHYLLFALIFLNVYPVTIILMPVAAFAILHVCNYSRSMLDVLSGPASFGIIRKGISYVIAKDKDLMRFIAVNEILIAPALVILIFSGKCGIFVPFIYYRFICMRYQSRRNPFNKLMFYELRLTFEQLISQPQCPQLVRNIVQRFIGFVIRLSPTQMAA
jgi:hypothetical protein